MGKPLLMHPKVADRAKKNECPGSALRFMMKLALPDCPQLYVCVYIYIIYNTHTHTIYIYIYMDGTRDGILKGTPLAMRMPVQTRNPKSYTLTSKP